MRKGVRGALAVGAIACLWAVAAEPVAAADNESMGGISGYQIRSDDCPWSACGRMPAGLVEREGDLEALGMPPDSMNLREAPGVTREEAQGQLGDPGTDQLVFLDFDSAPETVIIADASGQAIAELVSHVYTPEERAAIQGRLEADYARFPNISFTQVEPAAGSPFARVRFACGNGVPGSSCITFDPPSGALAVLFGAAESVDFRNRNRSDEAFVQADLPEFVVALGGFGFFNQVLGVPIDGNDPESVRQAISSAVVTQASNTAAHELGHLLGLRHHDSFGPPGSGLPTTGQPDPQAFIPVFDRGVAALETVEHLMASGETVALPMAAAFAADRFFSERSATKLLATRRIPLQSEALLPVTEDGSLALRVGRLFVPNTVLNPRAAGSGFLDVVGSVVSPAAVSPTSSDVFQFSGRAGQVISAEVSSAANPRAADPVVTDLGLFLVRPDGARELVAFNLQNFEGFDPLLLDVTLPEDGVYELLVQASEFLVIGGVAFPLEGPDADLATGTYELLLYSVGGPLRVGANRSPQSFLRR